MIDALGDRMKMHYENTTRLSLPRRSYTIIRIDGKAFHTYTRGCKRPFDDDLIASMNYTALELCREIQGAQFAYIQSDEISILVTDFKDALTEAWFGNNLQKMASVSASIATRAFNQSRMAQYFIYNATINDAPWAEFDARIFQIPSSIEVANYFIWRQIDATRNSINSVAHSLYSTKELQGIGLNAAQELIFQKGINWNDYDIGKKRGRIICRVPDPLLELSSRKPWGLVEPPVFTQDKTFLQGLTPIMERYNDVPLA